MIDPKLLYRNYEWVAKRLARRNFIINWDMLCKQCDLCKILKKKIEKLYIEKKNISKIINFTKSKGENILKLRQHSNLLNKEIISIKSKIQSLQNEIKKYQLSFPNIPDDCVPNGHKEENNVEIMRWGQINNFNFTPLDHIKLGNLIGQINFSNAAKISGTKFAILKGKIAYLHRALAQFMLDLHTKNHGYEEHYVPYLVNQESLYGSGQLPKFYSDLFHIHPISSQLKQESYTLIPTAEVALINLMKDVLLKENDLPIKMVAHTPCFRAEAGTYGHRTHGLIRLHQFDKIELVQIVHPDHSNQILEEITKHAEIVLQLLKLPYRKILLCSGNMSFASSKTYDLEVWLPSHNKYCEISSCSNVRDFQSRRIKARFKSKFYKKPRLLHTLNASGIAVGRAVVAILENYQLKDGRIEIPTVLHSYMNGMTHIE